MKQTYKVVIFLLTLYSNIIFSQVNTYIFTEEISSFTVLPNAGATVAYAAPWDNHTPGAAHQANIGFNFVFDGVTHSQCYISPNGFITFGVQPASGNLTPLSSTTAYTSGGAISALGRDLSSTSGNIIYNTIGNAPNRIFIVQWTDAVRTTISGNFNFQIILNETTNTIKFSYGVCSPDGASAISTQVGIRGESNSFPQRNVKNRLQNGSNINSSWFGKTIEGTANSSTTRTSIVEYPDNGLLYTFTPSLPCTTPTGNASNLVIGGTNVTATSFVGNSFTPASPAPTNYLVLRSTVNTPPTATDIPNRTYYANGNIISGTYTVVSITNATIFNQTGLTPNTTYFYWVIPYNAGCLGAPFYNLAGMASASKTTCIPAPTGVVASTVEGNSFTATWDSVSGATDYQIDVSTTSAFTAILPAYNGLSTAGATSIPVTDLNSFTTYYFRVRAVGLGCFYNSSGASVTTLCGSYSIPYFQNFDTTPVNTTPTCFTISDENADTNIWQVKNTLSASTPNSIQLSTSTFANSEDWFFTPGLRMNAGITYRLRFKYNTESAGIFTENLRVHLGSGSTVSNMNLTLVNLSNILNTVYQTAIVDFTIFIDGVYFIGFQGHSLSGQSKIMIDDIGVIVSPTCFEPSNIIVNSIGTDSAIISWDESVPAPSEGYQYYVSTSNIMPSGSETPSGFVGSGVTTANISSLSPATLYYVWVRGNCTSSDQSVWSLVQSFSTDCAAPTLIPVIGGTLCGGGSTILQATPAPGAVIEWFSDSAGTNLIATGDTFTTPNLVTTSTYYAQSKASGGLISVGPSSPTSHGGAFGSNNISTFINFNISTVTDLQSIDIYPMTSGQNGTITIKNDSNILLGTYNFSTSASGGNTAQTIPIGLNLLAGNYVFTFETVPASGLTINVDGGVYPYTSSIASIIGNSFDNTFYMYAYNWKFSNICRSLLTPVIATITPAPLITISQSTASLCFGESTPLVTLTGYEVYDSISWSPSVAITGDEIAGYTLNPTTTTNYVVTATQASGSMCISTLNFDVTVKPEPPAISIVPANATLCEGQIQLLNAALPSGTPAVILEENFNSSNSWTTTNLSTGGIPANSAWTLRNSPHLYGSTTFSSNDASRFYLTNSDSQGGPTSNRTRTYLESPTFNLTGYTSASLSFWHYLRRLAGNIARVEASIDNGVTWTIMNSYIAPYGGASSFVNATINLNSLVGNSAVKIRFYYDSNWGYYWAIDNVRITGNLAVEVTWYPETELYFDAAATNPYIVGTPAATVYAKPSSTITYIGTAIGSNGCSTSSNTILTVLSAPALGVLSNNQVVCGNWQPNDITLTGYTNSIVGWQYANDIAFTLGVNPIINNTNTLSGLAMGNFAGDRYFRVILQNETCPVVYSNAVLISKPVTAWDGISWSNGVPTASKRVVFNGNYNSTANVEACGVEVISGNVVFNTNHSLVVQNDVKVTGGSLTFQNNSSLVQVNTLDNNGVVFSNTGNITYRRTTTPIKKYDYTYWSSPVYPQTLGAFSPNSTQFYVYNPLIENWAHASTTIPMKRGKGYIIRTPDIAPFNTVTTNYFTGSFIGVPNTGDITTPIIGDDEQVNLIGNPYPSAINADLFLSNSLNTPIIDATIYLWTHNTPITGNQYTSNDYAMYNYSGGIGTGTMAINSSPNNSIPNGKIASGQSFFVKGLSNGNAIFNNSMRVVGNNNQFFRLDNTQDNVQNEIEKHRFWVDIYNETGGFKELLVAYVEGATNDFDRGFDGEMMDINGQITMYVIQDNKKLSIQGRALPFFVDETIPLGYKSNVAGSFNVRLADFDGLFIYQNIYLEDKLLNIIHDLKASEYVFTTTTGTFDDRFELRYINELLGVDDPEFNDNTVIIYKNQIGLFINTGKISMNEVSIYDVRGRLLASQSNINNTSTVFETLPMTQQVLLVKIISEDGEVVIKKVMY